MSARRDPFSRAGHRVIRGVRRLGLAFRFLAMLFVYSAPSLRRFRMLTMREIYMSGVFSLLIVVAPGLFIGLVLGLQG